MNEKTGDKIRGSYSSNGQERSALVKPAAVIARRSSTVPLFAP